MERYEIRLTEKAARFYESANAGLRARLDRCFDLLASDPRRHPNIKPLRGPLAGKFRFRVGDYRVIYKIDDPRTLVVDLVIAHRREAY